jgi:hypothetical protein
MRIVLRGFGFSARILSWAIGWAVTAYGQSAPVDSAQMRPYEAQVTAVQGQVTRLRDKLPWALSNGEHIPVSQVIITGRDGYAHFTTAGGNNFDIFSNSRVVFRQNTADTGDLIDVLSGRVRVHMQPLPGQRQRVFCPTAIISTYQPSTLSLAVDEDNAVRIDVSDGSVRVQHALRPSNDLVMVRASDAILVEPNEPISHRVDRGTLYRYTARIWAAITFSHSDHSAEPLEGNQLLAASSRHFAF